MHPKAGSVRIERMGSETSEILVIGAGMAGLACATRLSRAGKSVIVLDKGRGPGGRMAARRVELAGEEVGFDHGAQYFTARDPVFEAQIVLWSKQDVVALWPAAGEDAWVGVPGMNGPIRAMAETLDVRWNVRAERLTHDGTHWCVSAGEESYRAATILIAIPAEQTSDLLAEAAPDFAEIAAGVTSQPCWAAMAAFSERLPIGADTLRDPDARISWAARNSAKPHRAGRESWVIHASPARSREVLDKHKEEVAQMLLADFFAQTGIAPVDPVHCAAHRWLYAMPSTVEGEPASYDANQQIGIAGDYLHSPRVEGAFLSGAALAQKVLSEN